MIDRDDLLEACARAAHEANRAYCIALGDTSQPAWKDAPAWQCESVIVGVEGVLAGNLPRESHASWLAVKERDGWTYAPTKNVENKQHPCMVPYDDLPPAQKAKDHVFVEVVRAVARALGYPLPDFS